ncbi:hypothetical protein ASF60_02160 [Methylobacterium sp. Leaf113]|nr:hypothetical protein ASF60_02160 [Methylobacterium sp. Leaf113]
MQCRSSGHQHHIGRADRQVASGLRHGSTKTPPDAIALRGVTDALRNGEADTQPVAGLIVG